VKTHNEPEERQRRKPEKERALEGKNLKEKRRQKIWNENEMRRD